MTPLYRIFFYAIFLFSILLLWEYAASYDTTIRILLSSPIQVFEYMGLHIQDLLEATFVTFIEAFVGFAIAFLCSFILTIIASYFPVVMELLFPLLFLSQIIPLITLAPLFILLFSFGLTAKIMMAALLCFFPIFINFANGIKRIDTSYHELLYLYQASTTQKIFKVYIPLSTPYLMNGLKIAATLAVVGAIVAEFNGASIGLGKNLFIAAKRIEPELMVSSLFFSTMLGGIFYGSIYILEKYVGSWYVKENI